MKGMKMTKVLSLLLCLVMLVGVLPMVSFAADDCAHQVEIAATCKNKAVCSICHDVYGSYGDHVQKIPATCNSKAVCAVCGDVYGEYSTKHVEKIPATCNSKAVCAVCGDVYGEYSTKHVEKIPATCKSKAVCAVCGDVYGEYSTKHVEKIPATCKSKAVCAVCGDVYGEYSTEHVEKIPATCKSKAVCAVCGDVYGEYSTKHVEKIPATCKNKAVCNVCGDVYDDYADCIYSSNGLCTVCKKPAGSISITLSANKFTYNGKEHKPSVTVKAGNVTISADYVGVEYLNNKNAGTATAVVSVDNFGTVNKDFTIEKAKLTIGPKDVTVDQNTSVSGTTLYYKGLISGDKVTVSPAPVFKFYDASGEEVNMSTPVNYMGKYTIKWVNECTIDVTNSANYDIDVVRTATLNIIPTKAEFEIAGVKTYATVDGYAVNMHKFSDENVEKILDNPDKDGVIQLKFKPVSYLNYINTVRIPTELVEEIAEAANDAKSDVEALEVTLINGRSIKFDAKALADIEEKAEGKFVAVVMVKSHDAKTSEIEPLKKAQTKDLGDRPAYAFEIVSGKEMLEDVAGSFVMQIPYKTRYNETEDGLKVSFIDEEGKRTAVKTSYDEDTDKVVWEANALGLYVIEHESTKK